MILTSFTLCNFVCLSILFIAQLRFHHTTVSWSCDAKAPQFRGMSQVTISKRESMNSKKILKKIKEGLQGVKTGPKDYSQSLSHITPIL